MLERAGWRVFESNDVTRRGLLRGERVGALEYGKSYFLGKEQDAGTSLVKLTERYWHEAPVLPVCSEDYFLLAFRPQSGHVEAYALQGMVRLDYPRFERAVARGKEFREVVVQICPAVYGSEGVESKQPFEPDDGDLLWDC